MKRNVDNKFTIQHLASLLFLWVVGLLTPLCSVVHKKVLVVFLASVSSLDVAGATIVITAQRSISE